MKTPTDTPSATDAAESTTPPAAPLIVRVRVIKPGLAIAGCRAGKNAMVNCTEEAAKWHADRGEVEILGTA